MNISATAAMGYTYTNIKTGVSQKKDVSNENTCEKQTQKEYKNVVISLLDISSPPQFFI